MAKGFPYSLGRAPKESPAVRKYRYDVRDLAVTVAAASTAVGFGSAVLGDLPEGNILYMGGIAYLQFDTADTDIGATWSGDFAVGTTATADVTVDGTDANLIGLAAVGPAVARLSPYTRGEGDTVNLFDNTDGSLELNLNVLVDAANIADDTDADFIVNGYVELVYVVLGDD